MPHFSYKGRNAAGELVAGKQEAASAGQVAGLLAERQITPVSIDEVAPEKPASASIEFKDIRLFQRVKLDELILLSRQMYSLTKAGVPITRAMRGLAMSVRNPLLERTLNEVTDDLEQGNTLSGSLRKHSKVFSPLYISLIHVGENTGNLDQVFLQISKYLELERNTIKNIKSATRYPMFVIGAIALAMVVINIWVIPAFAGVFSKLGAELPWQTQLLISISDFMRSYWYVLLGIFVVALFSFFRYTDTEKGRFKWDRMKLRFPIVGGLFTRIALGRFSRTFSLVLRSGIPIEQGLTIVSGAIGNSYIGKKVQEMRHGIERGEGFTRTAHSAQMFSPLVLQMIGVGEETGNIDDMLEQTADFYEQEVEYDLKGLASAIEPVLIVAIGGMVLVLALGVFLPLWELSGAVNR
ncbi:type II secretion system F family protein [Motiliproteus sp. MSK22-1]|uniref:type II secretion system F family protein n=1 Tax=Motiliproteus sp. MSK22-1 TaxID=1897630 RepID=UPI00097571F4|nr:type II secretion system F family protein [Motiliproteus sp. MSK22-1]OMH39531.1 MSHA biogenesis protein MshG [Motiliproteus sp. MSK22-1]